METLKLKAFEKRKTEMTMEIIQGNMKCETQSGDQLNFWNLSIQLRQIISWFQQYTFLGYRCHDELNQLKNY